MDEAPRRILLVRTSALGDVVHCLPVLTALRRHLPASRIAWVVEEAMAPLLAGHPDLDRVIPVRLRPWRRTPFTRRTRQEVRDAVGALKDFAPDLALELMGNHKGGILASVSGAPRIVGLARRHRREPSSAVWINRPVTPPARPGADGDRGAAAPLHAVDRGLVLLAALGLPAEPADFAGHRLLPSSVPPPDAGERPYAVLHPGAGWGNKAYPPARWGEVARHLAEETGVETRVTVGPGEAHLAEAVAAASGGTARAVEAADLAALTGLLRGARLVLGGDTGPLHLAHALGAPVLQLHGPTDPRRHGPYGAPRRALWETLPCSFCYKRLGETKVCLLALPARRVARRAVELLAEGGEKA